MKTCPSLTFRDVELDLRHVLTRHWTRHGHVSFGFRLFLTHSIFDLSRLTWICLETALTGLDISFEFVFTNLGLGVRHVMTKLDTCISQTSATNIPGLGLQLMIIFIIDIIIIFSNISKKVKLSDQQAKSQRYSVYNLF